MTVHLQKCIYRNVPKTSVQQKLNFSNWNQEIWGFFSRVMVNRSFSVTWSAPLQIAWNKRKKILTCEKSSIPTGCFCTQTWPPIHRFVHKYGCRDVMWKRSISKEITGNKKISKWMGRVCNKLKSKDKELTWLFWNKFNVSDTVFFSWLVPRLWHCSSFQYWG